MARIWTNDELKYLKDWAGKSGIVIIAENLRISPVTARKKARELGLPKAVGGRGQKIVPPPFTGKCVSTQGRRSKKSLYERVKLVMIHTDSHSLQDICFALGDLEDYTTKQVEQAMERARKRLGLSA